MEMTIHDAQHLTTDSLRGPLPLSSNLQRLKTHLLRETGSAISDYKMIEEGDRILCAVSGGMDSFAMLTLLLELQKRAPIRFEVIAVNVDQKQPGFPEHVLPAHFESLGVAHRIVEQDTYSVVTSKIPAGKTMCGLCSRLRRGILYRVADEIKATKIALGHHMDDIVETLFLNMFFGGKLKAMPPKLLSDDGKHVVIRPMAYCEKRDIAKFARGMNYPIIPCNLCGSQENLQRVVIRKMLAEWNTLDVRRKKNIFRAIQNVCPSHLADFSLFDFARLKGEKNQHKPL